MNTTTTANEELVLSQIGTRFFSYFDQGVSQGSHTWSDEFSWEVADLLNISNQAAGGVISSLIQKNIFQAFKSKDGIELQLTEIGVEAIERVRA